MSLYGALYSGVSGLTAQSSAMGAISDNITNVSTVGYKNTNVNFQTLVTKQTSTTFYSAGGVQSSPRQAVDVQGLLQASTSQTDIALSGGGFFVVNSSNQPTLNDPYYYTRAGSFKQDSEGFLSNASGHYLQAWPTDASGNVIPANDSLTQTNLNVISSDYMETVNLSRVAGSAAATNQISIGANLPANAQVGDQHRTDVQFFDSLGEARTMSFTYTNTTDNQWDIATEPPQGTSTMSLYDGDGNVYDSHGQLEFNSRPADGSQVVIDGITYEFDSKEFGWVTASAANNLSIANGTMSDTMSVTSAGAGGSVKTAAAANNFVVSESIISSTFTVTSAGAGAEQVDITANNMTFSNSGVDGTADRLTAANVGTFLGLAVGDAVDLAGLTDSGQTDGSYTISAIDPAGTWIEFADGTLDGANGAEAQGTIDFPVTDRISGSAGDFSNLTAGDTVTLGAGFTDAGSTVTITSVAADGSYIELNDGDLSANDKSVATTISNDTADRITANAGTFSGLVTGDSVTLAGFNGGNGAQTITSIAADGSWIEFADGTMGNNETLAAGATVTYPSADRITATTAGQFSSLSVGDSVTLSGFTNAGNNVTGTITAVDASGNWIEFADGTLALDEASTAGVTLSSDAGDRIVGNAGTFNGLVVGDQVTMSGFSAGSNVSGTITQISSDGSWVQFADGTLGADETVAASGTVTYFNAGVGETSALKRVDISSNTAVGDDVASLVARVIAADSDFDAINDRIQVHPDYSNIVQFSDDGTGSFNVNPSGVLTSTGAAATTQTNTFTVQQQHADYSPYSQLVFNNVVPDGEIITINGQDYTFSSTETAGNNDTTISTTAGTVAAMLTDLEAAIEANDPFYSAGGDGVRLRANNQEDSGTFTNNTLVLGSLTSGPYDVNLSGQTTAGIVDDIDGTDLAQTTYTVQSVQALNFDSQGTPSSINVASVQVTGFDNGASDMDSVDSDRMSMDFGTIGGSDGMTQFGTEFTPVFIQQNGSRFGTFAGVSISPEGLVTALFDNGDTRPIYQIPVATFTNPNGLEGRTGNIWNASEASGDYTLRTAGNGPAGTITQASLEASTVDIGEEFTSMIVVQRAYSASTKIISTADQMLEELMRTKR